MSEENSSKQENTRFLFENTGLYPVVLAIRDENGCGDTIVKSIKIEPDFAAYVPAAFTPNGDGRNELFMPVLRGVKFFTFSVFNRWGKKLYETKSLNTGWDGKYGGEDCPGDMYVWKMILSANNGEQKEMLGNVTLYR